MRSSTTFTALELHRAGHRAGHRAACWAGCHSRVEETCTKRKGQAIGQGRAGLEQGRGGQGRPDDRAPASSPCAGAQLRGVFSPQVSQGATQQVIQEAHAAALILQPHIHHAGTAKQLKVTYPTLVLQQSFIKRVPFKFNVHRGIYTLTV